MLSLAWNTVPAASVPMSAIGIRESASAPRAASHARSSRSRSGKRPNGVIETPTGQMGSRMFSSSLVQARWVQASRLLTSAPAAILAA